MHGDVDMIVSATHDRLVRVSREENILLQNNGVRSQIVDATPKRSFLWKNGDISVEQSLGELKIKLPNDPCLEIGTLSDLCDFVYADLNNNFTNPVWLANRTIVTLTNEAAQFVNDFLLTKIPGELKIYRSSDTVDNETLYPIEFINKHTTSGFLPHILKLKKKLCIMLLRNLDATNGHCNDTSYIIVSLHDHVIEADDQLSFK
uniref:DNA helicase Pif1-like 2B domain-containing protein n=1 Tax=Octopus bimaculoides TaxID=37653 RepID=A0A0L8HHV4_OCTBM